MTNSTVDDTQDNKPLRDSERLMAEKQQMAAELTKRFYKKPTSEKCPDQK